MPDNIRPFLIVLFAVGLVLLLTFSASRNDAPAEQPAQKQLATKKSSAAAPPAPEEQLTTREQEQNREIPDITERFNGDLGEMRKRKQIRALVTYSRTDFFFYKGRAKGLQVEFLLAYEKFLNKGIKRPENKIHISFLPVPFDQLIPALNQGRGDISAAFLTITPQRQEQVAFATGGRFRVSELVVSNRNKVKLERIEDLSGKRVYVLNNSSYVQHLEQLNARFKKQGLQPVVIEQADPALLSEDILELVDSGIVNITVVDDYKAKLWAQLFPDLQVHEDLEISRDNQIGWAFRNHSPELGKSLDSFAKKIRKGTLLGNMLFRRYYKDTGWINNPTSKNELKKLSRSVDLFRKYAQQYDFDYLALLAQAYQESGLDQNKKSHRGAIGIMQMLPSTARDRNVNIKNIKVLENNIHAGTRYLAFLRDRYFSDPAITAENRQAFTWAAYNAGPANVIKMRNKAKAMGLDPNIWFSNVEVAASKLIGRETVQYVAHIHKYYIAYKLASTLNSDDTLFLSQADNTADSHLRYNSTGVPASLINLTQEPGVTMPVDCLKVFQAMPVFGGISNEALMFLLERTLDRNVPEGGYFFHERDEAESMFILVEGRADIIKLWEGQACTLRQLSEGDCFGEVALMDLMQRCASIRAATDCQAIELHRRSLYELYKEDVEQFAMIQMNMGREVSRRLRQSDNRLFEVEREIAALNRDHIYRAI